MKVTISKKQWATIIQISTHIGSLIPFAWLLWDYQFDQLTANPIQAITLRTGKAAITLLVLSLACTPLNIVLGLKQLLPLRRPLGLYAFFYVCLHLTTFVFLDYGLDWGLIKEAIFEKRYALVGFTAFLLLLPLAITSTKGWMKRLGKNWKRLHQLVYVAALLAVIHYVWLIKSDYRQPLVYGAIVVILLLIRQEKIKTWVLQQRGIGKPAARRPQPAKSEPESGH